MKISKWYFEINWPLVAGNPIFLILAIKNKEKIPLGFPIALKTVDDLWMPQWGQNLFGIECWFWSLNFNYQTLIWYICVLNFEVWIRHKKFSFYQTNFSEFGGFHSCYAWMIFDNIIINKTHKIGVYSILRCV